MRSHAGIPAWAARSFFCRRNRPALSVRLRCRCWDTTSMKYDFIPLDFKRLAPEEQRRRAIEFYELAQRRRTVRDFSPDPVPFELIELAIKTAGVAPSGANQQPWRFVVVSDPEIKRRIRLAAEEEECENYGGRFPDEWLRALAPLGTDWHKEFLEVAPY